MNPVLHLVYGPYDNKFSVVSAYKLNDWVQTVIFCTKSSTTLTLLP